jgi:hypothetical protein
MAQQQFTPGGGEIDRLILQALIRKLITKSILSVDEVRALLFEAAIQIDIEGSKQTPQAASLIVDEDLAPLFLGAAAEQL